MKFTITVFSLLELAAVVFAGMHNGSYNFTPPFNITPGFFPSNPASPKGDGEDSGDITTPENDTARCNQYFPFPHGPPHFAPGCTPTLVPHDAASRISDSYAALAVGIIVIIFSL